MSSIVLQQFVSGIACSQVRTGNQVTSFHLPTEDGESIHAWHVLPLPAYRQHQEALEIQPTGHCGDVTTSESLRILKNDPTAKLILYRKCGGVVQALYLWMKPLLTL